MSVAELNRLVNYSFPTDIVFGPASRLQIAEQLRADGLASPLVVTDKTLAALPMVDELVSSLRAAGLQVAVFSDVFGNPTESQVMACAAAYAHSGADSVLALGGGAPMDVAKAAAVMVNHPGTLFEYEDGRDDCRPFDCELPPIWAVPTTAGTGSEVGRSAVISEDDSKRKRIIFSPGLLPARVFVDPELTIGLPTGITAATGMDALAHNVEAWFAPGFSPLCDGIALQGVRLVGSSLRRCVDYARHGQAHVAGHADYNDHLACRGEMLMASLMGATAFQKGLGVVHSMGHALSAVKGMHHGMAIALVLPHAVRFNSEEIPERATDLLWAATQGSATSGTSVAVGEEPVSIGDGDFAAWIGRLLRDLSLPNGLGEVGVVDSDIPDLVDLAAIDPCLGQNPRSVSRDDLKDLFTAAIGGIDGL